MSRIRAGPLGLALLLLTATLAGCAAPAPTADDATPDASPGRGDAPGHPLSAPRLRAATALVDGIRHAVAAEGVTTWRLDADVVVPSGQRALVLHGARVDGREGVLFALPQGETLALEGAVRYEAVGLAFSNGTMRHRLPGPPGGGPVARDDALDARTREAGLFEAAFFAARTGLRADGPLVVEASRVVLVHAEGVSEVGPRARVEAFSAAAATTGVERVLAPEPTTVAIDARRGHLALGDAQGDLSLPRAAREARLDGAAILTLGRGATMTFEPEPRTVRLGVEGRAFQVVTSEGPLLRSRLELRIPSPEAFAAPGEPTEIPFELHALDPDADPVISAIRIERLPREGLVRLPGYVPLTQQVLDAFGDDPIFALGVLPGMPAILVADFLLGVVDFFAGPAKITQTIEAGTTFRSRLQATGHEEPYEATLVVEGNFPTTRATVRVG